MSQEKQIEELRGVLWLNPYVCLGSHNAHMLARYLHNEGYRKLSEGKWEIVNGSNGREKMVCTNCRHQQDLASTFTYCPNCGAKINGRITYEQKRNAPGE